MNKRFEVPLLLLFLVGCSSDYEKGLEKLNATNYKEAIALFEKVKKQDESYNQAQEKLNVAYYKLGEQACDSQQWNTAIDYLDNVKSGSSVYDQAQEKSSAAYYELGKQAYDNQEWSTALLYMDKVKVGSSVYDQAQEKIGTAHFNLGKQAYDNQEWGTAVQYLSKVKAGNVYDQAQKYLAAAQKEVEERAQEEREEKGYMKDGWLRATLKEKMGWNAEATAYSVLEKVWRFSTTHPEAKKMKLRVILTGENKYGEHSQHDLGILSVDNLDEVRRYRSSTDYSYGDLSGKVGVVMLFQQGGYF